MNDENVSQMNTKTKHYDTLEIWEYKHIKLSYKTLLS